MQMDNPDTRVDPALAWELAKVERGALYAKAELHSQMPSGFLGRLVHQPEIQKIVDKINIVDAATSSRLETIEDTITANRKQNHHVKAHFETDDEAYRAYIASLGGYSNHYKLSTRYEADLSFLKKIGTAIQARPGTSSLVLFDSSVPSQQLHGLEVSATLQALSFFSPDSPKSQFKDTYSRDEQTGVATSSARLRIGGDVKEDAGRYITVNYTDDGTDVSVSIDVHVDNTASDFSIPLPKQLEKALVYEIDYACGSMWSDIGFRGMGREQLAVLNEIGRQFEALGGVLSKAQSEAYREMVDYKRYLDGEYSKIAALTQY